jgi:hypothetical protein
MIYEGDCGAIGGMKIGRETKYSEKTCLSATLSTTNPTWPNPGSNLGRRGGKPATNRLSYGAAPGLLLVNPLWQTACKHFESCFGK